MDISSSQKFCRMPEVMAVPLEEGCAMMEMETGRYFSLNEVSEMVWNLLSQPISLNEICERMTEEYDVSFETCQTQVSGLLQQMRTFNLIEEKD